MSEDGTPGRIPATTPEEVMTVFDERTDLAEPLSANEVADEVGCSRQTAYKKLDTLVEEGKLTKKKIGSVVYWKEMVPTNSE